MRIRRFGHAGIEVGDLSAAEAFYRNVFGFEVTMRFPEDGEVMFAVGDGDHLLLHSARADGNRNDLEASQTRPGPAGLNHAAFELVEGHREVLRVRDRLAELGVAFQDVDHDGDPSVYFHDPDGNLLEVYAAPGSTPRFRSAEERWHAARRFVYGTARPIDRAIFEHVYAAAPARRVLDAADAYRNADGGFGHAIEPDVRCPASQTIHTLTGLELLREADVASPDIADGCCEFLSARATDAALPALLPDALDFPAAAHWQSPSSVQPSLTWTFGVVAQLAWHGARHPWFEHARQACLGALDEHVSGEAHHLLYVTRFVSELLEGEPRAVQLARCRESLRSAQWFVAETPVERYGLTPLHYAPSPDAPCRGCFDDGLIASHLDDLLAAQQGDGGWPIRFDPPSAAAREEWRGRWTLEALAVLKAYGRLPA